MEKGDQWPLSVRNVQERWRTPGTCKARNVFSDRPERDRRAEASSEFFRQNVRTFVRRLGDYGNRYLPCHLSGSIHRSTKQSGSGSTDNGTHNDPRTTDGEPRTTEGKP